MRARTDEDGEPALAEQRLTDGARALPGPVLLVRGRESDLLSEEAARFFLDLVPHAEFTDVANAGHMVAGDRNDIFNSAVISFLDRLPLAPSGGDAQGHGVPAMNSAHRRQKKSN